MAIMRGISRSFFSPTLAMYTAALAALLAFFPPAATAHRLKGAPLASDALLVDRFAPEPVDHEATPTLTGRGASMSPLLRLLGSGRLELVPLAGHPGVLAGERVAPPQSLPFAAREFLPSWNIDFDPQREGFAFEARFLWGEKAGVAAPSVVSPDGSAKLAAGTWSEWFQFGVDGVDDPTKPKAHLRDEVAFVDDDYMIAKRGAVAWQWRLRAWRVETPTALNPRYVFPDSVATNAGKRFGLSQAQRSGIRLRLVTLAASEPRPTWVPGAADAPTTGSAPVPPTGAFRRGSGAVLGAFPWRTQIIGGNLEDEICCPTSIAIVREYWGDDRVTTEVLGRAYDRNLGIFGSWPRAAQVLSEATPPPATGPRMRAWSQRFRSLDEALPFLQAGIPIIMSTQVRRGELKEYPEDRTNGHILVLRGVTAEGRWLVSNPGRSARKNGYDRTYCREDIERMWIHKGGVGVIAAPTRLGLPLPQVTIREPQRAKPGTTR